MISDIAAVMVPAIAVADMNDTMNRSFSRAECRTALNVCKVLTTPGLDGITSEIVRDFFQSP